MLATMIGIGPHEMTTWGWAAMIGLTVFWAVLAVVAVLIVARMLGNSGGHRA